MADVSNGIRSSTLRASALPFDARGAATRVVAALPLQAVPLAAPLPEVRQSALESTGRARFVPRLTLVVSDLVALSLCLLGALYLVRQPGAGAGASVWFANIVLSLPLFAAVLAFFSFSNLYAKSTSQVLRSSFAELREIIYGLGIAGCAALSIDHFFGSLQRRASVEQMTLVLALLLSAVVIPFGRGLSRAALRALHVEQFRLLIVGSGMMTRHLLRYLSWDPRITVVGCVDDDPVPGTAVLGTIDELPRLVEELRIDQVMVGFSRTHPSEALHRLQSLNDRVAISIVPRYFELMTWRAPVKELSGLALIEIPRARLSIAARTVKRAFDLVVGALTLALMLPLLAAIAVGIKVTSPGPVLFRQERIGRDNKLFKMYKLRTMTVDSESMRSKLADANEMDGPLFKMRVDPRVTKIGRFLRRTSLDELPQLFNVLLGDMALVGPRPFIPDESNAINGSAQRRFEVRPGITGLWQVSGRSELSFDELQRLDYLYVAAWSIWWDLQILWVTPARVLRGHGAF